MNDWRIIRERPERGDHTPFVSDRQRILACSAFRRLAGKTQVLILPEGDHYRNRLTHTLDVADISRAIARPLDLDEDLVEAIALGHDLGHTPFGHAGERGLDAFCRTHLGHGFEHREQSLRVVETLANRRTGLNLTAAVRNGILCHSGPRRARTPEGQIVATADRIAYLTHDVDDAIHANLITAERMPKRLLKTLGRTPQKRRERLIADMVTHSSSTGKIGMSEGMTKPFLELRKFMFTHVYLAGPCAQEAAHAAHVVQALAEHYLEHMDDLPKRWRAHGEQGVVDYVSGMTDRFALRTYRTRLLPSPGPV